MTSGSASAVGYETELRQLEEGYSFYTRRGKKATAFTKLHSWKQNCLLYTTRQTK